MMKKIYYFLAIAVCAVLMASCSKTPKYTKFISDDAAVVLKFNAAKLADESQIKENEKLKKQVKEALKSSGMDRKTHDKFVGLLEDPASLGIDFREPLIMGIDLEIPNNPNVVLVGAIHDADKFTETLNALAKEANVEKVKTKGDYHFLNLERMGIVYDDKWLHVGAINYGTKADEYFDDIISEFENTNTKNTMYESKYMKEMCDYDGVMQTLINYGELMSVMPDSRELNNLMPDGFSYDDMMMLVDFDIDGSDINVTTLVMSENEKYNEMLKKGDNCIKSYDKDLLKYVSRDGISMIMAMDFEEIVKNDYYQHILEMLPAENAKMIKKIVSSIEGDGIVSCSGLSANGQLPLIDCYIKTNNNDIVQTIAGLSPEIKKEGANKYSIADNNATGKFGYENDITYFVWGSNPKPFKEATNCFSSSDVKGKGSYFYVSATFFKNLLKNQSGMQVDIAMNYIKLFEYAEAYYEGKGKAIMSIHSNQKHILESLIETTFKSVKSALDFSKTVYNQPGYEDYAYEEYMGG